MPKVISENNLSASGPVAETDIEHSSATSVGPSQIADKHRQSSYCGKVLQSEADSSRLLLFCFVLLQRMLGMETVHEVVSSR